MTEHRISDYGDETDRPPMLHKDEEFDTRISGKGTVTAYRGPIVARRSYGALQFRRRDEHFHNNEDGYALSEKLLRRIRTFGCELILIAEEDTRCVFEFHESQFDRLVSKKNNPNHDDDPQRVTELSTAWHVWPEHTADVMVGERGHN